MTSLLRHTALALALSAASLAAQAHNAWLLPSATVLAKPDWVSVDAAISNDLFVANHAAMGLDNLQITGPDGASVKPENATKLKNRSVFDLQLAQPGSYRVAVVNSGVFARWKDKASGQPKRARGTPQNIAQQIPADAQEVEITQSINRVETFIAVGKPSALKPIGQGLELVAAGNPTDNVKGEKSTFTLLLDGQPAKDLEVSVTAGGTVYRDKVDEIKLKTDAQGRFTVNWPAAGMYWLEASARDSKTSLPQAKERRLNYSATLEVAP